MHYQAQAGWFAYRTAFLGFKLLTKVWKESGEGKMMIKISKVF